jgi:ubiquinone/menaquinone biosynthesis C-methylase UbiE
MQRFESYPPDPTLGALSEIFRHPVFTEASESERLRIMLASSQAVYDDELSYPWDNYFGRDLTPFLQARDVLDLGCFTGGRTVAWSERYRPASISGIDVAQVFIDAAEAFAESRDVRASFTVGRGEELPYDADSFDAVVSFDVFEHVQDPGRVLEECRRVLKPGGEVFLVFPSFFQPIEHHISLVTTAPGIHYFFPRQVLVDAYCAIIDERGEPAAWYARRPRELQSWERGNTINGLTIRRFRRLAEAAGLTIIEQVRKPLGSLGRHADLRRRNRLVGWVLRPFTWVPGLEEAALHRGVFILRKPH